MKHTSYFLLVRWRWWCGRHIGRLVIFIVNHGVRVPARDVNLWVNTHTDVYTHIKLVFSKTRRLILAWYEFLVL